MSLPIGQKIRQLKLPSLNKPKKSDADTAIDGVKADDSPKDVEGDSVDIGTGEPAQVETPKKAKRSRKVRKAFLQAASTVSALYSAAIAIPAGAQLGLDTLADKPNEVKKYNSARLNTLSNVAAGAGAGLLVGGPVGLVCGGVLGYLGATMDNHLSVRSGDGQDRIDKVSSKVTSATSDKGRVIDKVKAVLVGSAESAKQAFKSRKITSKISLAGRLDGMKDAVTDLKEEGFETPDIPKQFEDCSRLTKTLLKASGVACGLTGVMINAPGGMIVGMLESLKGNEKSKPTQMMTTSMLLATNLGKYLPALAVAAVLGGPVGIAAGAALSLATGSLPSIIDGRSGVNRSMTRQVDKSVKESQGDDQLTDESLKAFYLSGKGSAVGLVGGIREGWKSGYDAGVKLFDGLLATTPESVASPDDAEIKKKA